LTPQAQVESEAAAALGTEAAAASVFAQSRRQQTFEYAQLLDQPVCAELRQVSRRLDQNLRHIEAAVDSDATESSSGGEDTDDDSAVSRSCHSAPSMQSTSFTLVVLSSLSI